MQLDCISIIIHINVVVVVEHRDFPWTGRLVFKRDTAQVWMSDERGEKTEGADEQQRSRLPSSSSLPGHSLAGDDGRSIFSPACSQPARCCFLLSLSLAVCVGPSLYL